MQFRLDFLAKYDTCSPPLTVLKIEYSSLLLVSEPEFHEEWLRDEPCDATTTCLGNPGVWCQLLLAAARNMRFGGRFQPLDGSVSHGTSSQLTFAHSEPVTARRPSVTRIHARDR